MSTTTTNYNLIKPELTDVADITAMNDNWDKLDQVIKENDVRGQINAHNTDGSAHNDIRTQLSDHINDKNNPHEVTAAQVGALPLDGSKSMTGALWLAAYLGRVAAFSNSTVLQNFRSSKDTNNGVSLDVSSNRDLAEALTLEKTVSGTTTSYKIFGEHNLSALFALGAAKISAKGTYTGTGTVGEDNQNSLTFEFTPKIVIISGGSTGFGVYLWGDTRFIPVMLSSSTTMYEIVTVSGNTMSWYATTGQSTNATAQYQFNTKSTKYSYIAIG